MRVFARLLVRPETAGLFGIIALRQVSGAALPVVLVVATADVRGFALAALVQAVRVAAFTFTTPLRARLVDRFGRARVIIPQTVIVNISLIAFAVFSVDTRIPIPLIFVACVIYALSTPAMNPVIRTEWKNLGRSPKEVKALHAADSILEEAGFLAGPVLASVAMLIWGPVPALYVAVGLAVLGTLVVFLPQHVRTALRQPVPARTVTGDRLTTSGRLGRIVRTVVGPIATIELQRIVLPLILMGTALGVLGILIPLISTQAGDIAYSGFLFGAISLGGLIGAFTYGSIRTDAPLTRRHGALTVFFGVPLVFAFVAQNVWALGILLVVAGLAVTPLYINAYLMMDEDLPEAVLHEANTWVPVGNNLGYTIGILIAGALADGGTAALAMCLSIVASAAVAYGIVTAIARGRRSDATTARPSQAES